MLSRSARRAASVLLAGGSIAALALGSAAGTATGADAATEPPQAAGAVLPVLDSEAPPGFDPAAIAAALTVPLADPALGSAPGAAVLDGSDGEVLLDVSGSAPMAPASSLKIATGTAVLLALGPESRISTRVLREADGTLVLVGGGDPMLLPAPSDAPDLVGAANLVDLAELTAAALRTAGQAQAALRYDAGLFTGPAMHPDWDPSFVAQGIVSPVSALTLDRMSQGVDPATLDADPAGTTARIFAEKLAAAGVTVTEIAAGAASGSGDPVASVLSAPLVAVVDRMLNISDNDVAEALFRLAALARGLPGSFAGGSQAVADTLAELGVPTPGLNVADGSGLSRNNRITALALAALLAHDSRESDDNGDGAAQAALSWLPPGLSVGGLTGSLAGRYEDPATAAGAGRVFAKTGTLTGVTSLTGLVATAQGRPLAFSVITNESTSTPAAQQALDRVAAALAACGCAAATP